MSIANDSNILYNPRLIKEKQTAGIMLLGDLITRLYSNTRRPICT